MAHIVIVVGHSRSETFADAMADAYADGARSGGHRVSLHRVADLSFDPILHGGYAESQPREPDLERVFQDVIAADHMVVIFPIWLGSMPAILKGLFERLFQPELFASQQSGGSFPQLLAGKSVRLVTTMGMPGIVYRWWYGAPALKVLANHIFGFLGAGPVRRTVHGMIGTASAAQREQWLNELGELGRAAR